MTTTDHGCHHSNPRWEQFGHAAERFAKRVAEDAKLFAERVEESVGDFARDMRREWSAPCSTASTSSCPACSSRSRRASGRRWC